MTLDPILSTPKARHRDSVAKWKAIVAEYQKPNHLRAIWQIMNSVGGYALLWVAMFFAMQVSWWLAIPLAALAGLFLIRVFIIFHDCGHGSFFKSKRANNFWGFITGLLTFTPYFQWRWEHNVHHATAGHLDRRGVGDIWTMTVQEYVESSRWRRFGYCLSRNPIVLFVFAPIYVFLIYQRFPNPAAPAREKRSVWMMNFAILGTAIGLISIFGLLPWFVLQLITISIAGSGGVWLFYVQHQFEDAYWESGDDWDYTDAALKGSSFYKLPRVLQWFSGNIGFHHIHHLSPRIPNYNLERCHKSDPLFHEVPPITLWASFRTATYRLWDEKSKKLIDFRQYRRLRKRAAQKEMEQGASIGSGRQRMH